MFMELSMNIYGIVHKCLQNCPQMCTEFYVQNCAQIFTELSTKFCGIGLKMLHYIFLN